MNRFYAAFLAVSFSCLLLATPAHAATLSWDGNTVSDDWDANEVLNTNWTSPLIPGQFDDVVFPDTATDYVVNLNGDRTVISATFSGVSGYTLNNNALTLSSGNITSTGSATHEINSNVQLGAAGAWNISGTSGIDVNGIISGGFQLTKSGGSTLALNGANTYAGGTTVGNGTLLLGNLDALGTGGLTINAGGTVDLDANTSRVHDDIAINDGTLNLVGTTLNASGSDLSGTTPNHNLTVSGSTGLLNATGSAWINLNGLNSDGVSLPGADGGSLSVSGGIFNLGPSATLSARGGNGASLSFAPGLAGSVSFSGGVSTLDGTTTLEGQFSGFNGGNVTVSSAADVTMTGTMDLRGFKGRNGISFGGNGQDGGDGGMLLIQGGNFTLDASGAIVNLLPGAGGLGNNGGTDGLSGVAGSIDVSGGTLTPNAGVIRGGFSMVTLDPIHLIGASINVTGGDVIATAAMTIRGGAAINLSAGSVTATSLRNISSNFNFTGGTLTVDTFLGNLTQDGGTLAPGASPGLTSVTGNYTINAGSFAVDLAGSGGVAGTDFDRLDVSGTAAINAGATLDVTLFGGFTPSTGDLFPILVAGTLGGTFDNENLPGGYAWGVDYDATTLSLEVLALLGDMNSNDVVNVADVPLFVQALVDRGAYDTVFPLFDADLIGDLDGSGTFDLGDLSAFSALFAPPPASAEAVPEPAALSLTAVLLMGIAIRQRRHV